MNKILIVEDEKTIRELLKRSLETEGYLVITAENGQTALNWIKDVRLDLAIVDLGLPDISGMEICRNIKVNPRTRATPIIILTGNTSNSARIEGNLDANADLFLNKPLSAEDLNKAIKMILEKSEKRKLTLRNLFRPGTAN